jgi:hypothetical protein
MANRLRNFTASFGRMVNGLEFLPTTLPAKKNSKVGPMVEMGTSECFSTGFLIEHYEKVFFNCFCNDIDHSYFLFLYKKYKRR